jgi:hypothetical protein
MSKKLAAIQNAKSFQERLALAEDKQPGTEFDAVFDSAKTALDLIQTKTKGLDIQSLVNATYPGPHTRAQLAILSKANYLADPAMIAARQSLECIGIYFACVFKIGNSPALDELAKAFNVWRHHRAKQTEAGIIRAELIALHGLFPPGKPRLTIVDNKMVEGKLWPKLSVRAVDRAVVQRLKAQGIEYSKGDNSKDIRRREIQRQAKMLNIPLDHTPGRPGQKRPQKP